jgi:hypothetical protein
MTRALLILALGAVLSAQQVRDPAVPRLASPPAMLSGIVVADNQNGTPIRRAMVSVRGGDRDGLVSVVTDDAGRFTVGNLSAGRYTIVATKPAYLDASYGAARPGRAGTPVTLGVGQRLDVLIAMSRGAALEGTIRDERGEPMADVPVVAIDGRELAALSNTAGRDDRFRVVTDDRGLYRIFGLPPGEYVVGATLTAAGDGEIGRRRDAEADALLNRLGTRASRGISTPTPEADSAPVGFAPTYYPGVSLPSAANRVRLGVGDERRGLDFSIAPVFVSTIEGTITRGDGQMASDVTLSVDIASATLATTMQSSNRAMTLSQPPDATGHFKFTNVLPGRYTLIARSGGAASTPGMGRIGSGGGISIQPFGGRGGSTPPADPSAPVPLFATAEIEATGQDVTGVALDLRPGVTLSGRVVFEPGATSVPADLSTVRLTLSQPRGSYMSTYSDGTRIGNGALTVSPASPAADGSFVLSSIGPGTYGFTSSVQNAPGWWLRSAIVDGRDLLDTPLRVASEGFVNVVLTFSDRHNELVGTVQTAAGSPAAAYFIVAVPAEPSLWVTGSRRMKSARPATDGSFVLKDLPAGNYLMVALTDFEARDFEDRSFFEQLAEPGRAIPVVIRDGQTTRQDIRIAQ